MWISLEPEADVKALKKRLTEFGLWTQPARGLSGAGLVVAPHSRQVDAALIRSLPGVADVLLVSSQHPLVDAQAGQTIQCGPAEIGPGSPPVLMAGPCGVESWEQIQEAASVVARAGGRFLRGGAYKPRTSPYSFRGHGPQALEWIRSAADAEGLAVVTEVLGEEDVERVAEIADLIQIGTRNMQNYALLKAVGETKRPVLLKRGMAATVEEWLLAGEHLLAAGASGVVFCERGVRGFDPQTRNLLDLGAVALLATIYKQPVVVDPSHATGRRDLVQPLARAALAAGAHGLLLEAHPDPAQAKSDGPQALVPSELIELGDLLIHQLRQGEEAAT